MSGLPCIALAMYGERGVRTLERFDPLHAFQALGGSKTAVVK